MSTKSEFYFAKRKAPEGASADYLSHCTPSAGE